MRAKTATDGGGRRLHRRENIQELAEKNIDFVGSLADNAAKARINRQRFAATQFVYEAEQDRYICPAGKPLLYEGRDERSGISDLEI